MKTIGSSSLLVHRERAALVELMRECGPDHATLCAGWTVHDLAAHIYVRERRFDSAPGMFIGALAPITMRTLDSVKRLPFEMLLAKINEGPGKFNPLSRDAIAIRVNTLELVVHHEDIRRSKHDWQPREFSDSDLKTMWQLFESSAKLMWRKARVPVTLMPFVESGLELQPVVASKRNSTWKSTIANTDHIIVSGKPVELILASFGRTECEIRIDGSANAAKLFADINRSV